MVKTNILHNKEDIYDNSLVVRQTVSYLKKLNNDKLKKIVFL